MKERNGVSLKEASLRGAEVNKKKKQLRIGEYNLNPSLCKHCKKSISYEKRRNKFCSQSCSASFHNLGVVRNVTNGEWRKKKCKNCGKTTTNKNCCSSICYSEWVKTKRRNKIEKNNALIDYRNDKWYLIEIRGHKCERCSTEQWMNELIPLDIHHKDGNNDNNRLDNLQLICPNCHRQTDNHGSKNKTSSKRKQYRKQRYDQGLSY